jgi:hypothetical protein
VPISSHRKLLSPKAMVVNVAETPGRDFRQASVATETSIVVVEIPR